MNTRGRAFRPGVVVNLEDRRVLSAVSAPLTASMVRRAIAQGPETKPTLTVTRADSGQAEVLTRSGRPDHHQLTFSAHTFNASVPKGAVTAIVTIKVDYHNESKSAITSATIDEPLGPNLAYDPGNDHTPPGGQLNVSTTANGSEDVQLKIPGGIPPGGEGYLEFQAEYHGV